MKGRIIINYTPSNQRQAGQYVVEPSKESTESDVQWICASNIEYSAFGYNAKTHNDLLAGKWVIKLPKGDRRIDYLWEYINRQLANGRLFEAKVSPPKSEFEDQVICVYTPNYHHKKEIADTLAILKSYHNLPPENIVGYKRNLETVSNHEIYYYSPDMVQNPLITLLDKIRASINKITAKWPRHTATSLKRDVLNDFHNYFSRNAVASLDRLTLITNWIKEYSERENKNPLTILMLQRRTGWTAFFNPKYTESVKVLRNLLTTKAQRTQFDSILKQNQLADDFKAMINKNRS